MKSISPLSNIHSNGLFGNFENKNEENLVKVSEIKNLLIVLFDAEYINTNINYI